MTPDQWKQELKKELEVLREPIERLMRSSNSIPTNYRAIGR